MISVESAFLLLGSAAILGSVFGWRRYNTALNPLTITSVITVGLFTLLSGVVSYSLITFAPYTEGALITTALLALVNCVGLIVPYMFRRAWLLKTYSHIIRCLDLDSARIANKFKPIKFMGLLLCMLLSLVTLAIIGGGGIRWITDTREAYIQNRSGAGPFFASMQWFLIFALIYYIWTNRPQKRSLFLIIFLFACLAYFSGSKNNILSVAVIGVFYYNYYMKPILLRWYLIIVPPFLAGIVGLLIIQDSGLSVFQYFKEYFDTTAWFISRFDEFGFQNGYASFSVLWSYVPRALYPDKPYEYGVVLIHKVLFPNMAERGSTPGILPWATAYLDFGVLGVFADGLLKGVWQRAAYEYFLNSRQSFFAFLFAMQFALWPILPFATEVMTIILALGLSIYFRLTFGSRRYIEPQIINQKHETS
ncbi:MAG: hypothetical protein JZU65_23530 [Chlorobium sp.]|nr:hypothetical protein [Chlorobium sp.]